MRLYDRQSTYLVLGGVVIIHGLILALTIHFLYRFCILSYDPLVFPLLLLLDGFLVLMDALAHRSQAFSRFLVRCKVDESGIFCCGLGWKSWMIPWDEICVYGISGHSMQGKPYRIMFFSINKDEEYDKKRYALLDSQRIVFQVRKEIWSELSSFMPDDIKKRLQASIDMQTNCFHRRRCCNKNEC